MSEQEALIGRVVDERYRVVEPLGEGGMGLVFRAEHIKLQRPVALKVLHQEFVADSDLLARFDREARALAALAHPNIVTITDYGVMDQTPYLVMELLEGETLHHRLRHGALAPERAIPIARQMLRALSHAHRQGLVHRDLKPGNIFLTPLPDDSDHVKILDFGLVRFVDSAEKPDEKNLTRAGSMLGTPAYMAPEQVSGEPSDARTDVYAAAIVIFEMLAGRKPFVGEPAEILRQHLLTPAPALTEVHRGLAGAEELTRLLARALEKEQRLRFTDGGEMLAALEEVRVPTTTSRAPSGPAELATMPTMHARDASKDGGASMPVPTAVATPPRIGRAAPTAPPSSTLRIRPESLHGLKRTAAAVGGGLAIAGVIVGLLLLAASGGDEPAEQPAASTPAAAGAPGTKTPRPREARSEPANTRPAASAPGSAAAPIAPEASPAPPTAAAPGARPAARDPWAAGIPRELSRAKRAVDSGRVLRESVDRGLMRYAQVHQDDPRPHLLLAHAFLTRGWRSDAVERYELAARKDSAARGDPRMLEDLVALTTLDDRASSAAARAVRSIYGAEAIAEIDRQLGAARDRGARGRLARLKESIESGGTAR